MEWAITAALDNDPTLGLEAGPEINLDTETFDEFLDRKSKIYFLRPVHDELIEEGHLRYACTCPYFLHYALCKHVLSVALHEDEEGTRARFKPEWQVTRIGVRPRAGRPRKLSRALVMD